MIEAASPTSPPPVWKSLWQAPLTLGPLAACAFCPFSRHPQCKKNQCVVASRSCMDDSRGRPCPEGGWATGVHPTDICAAVLGISLFLQLEGRLRWRFPVTVGRLGNRTPAA
jgi:hypothetical protein